MRSELKDKTDNSFRTSSYSQLRKGLQAYPPKP
jgi:hypothetical protein